MERSNDIFHVKDVVDTATSEFYSHFRHSNSPLKWVLTVVACVSFNIGVYRSIFLVVECSNDIFHVENFLDTTTSIFFFYFRHSNGQLT